MQAIILAGGFGTRLQSIVKDVPKPMADINGLPFLSYLFTYLKNHNITDVVLSVGYLHQKIIDYFGNSYLGINIKYAIETEPLGTGGAILNSLKFIDQNQPVIILNGDTFLQIDYQKLSDFHEQKESDLTIVLRHLEDCSRYGSVTIDDKNSIVNFSEKNLTTKSGYINGGIYVINPKIFSNYNLPNKFSFEQDFLSKYLKATKPFGFIAEEYFIDIGIPEDYQKAQDQLPEIIKHKALFLDRDGVINIDHGYVGKKEDFHFIDGIFELCQKAQNAGYLIIIVTNQAGIAKGYYSEEQFLELTKWIEGEFLKHNIKITKTYYCPYHIEGVVEKYKQDSFDRKPNPGMLLKAIKEFNIDPVKSVMIGDKESDILAAERANIGLRNLFLVDVLDNRDEISFDN
ncbi:MAG: D-glycero-beta-D-manno-heptose 1,7-bisphosphate 7-phosphatase [Pseudomonadota bacterium]